MSRMRNCGINAVEGNDCSKDHQTPGRLLNNPDIKFERNSNLVFSIDEENISILNDEHFNKNSFIQRMERYTLPLPNLKGAIYRITLDEIYEKSNLVKRDLMEVKRREKKLNRHNLKTSDERIRYFKRELQKNRISFVEDSITLVINRSNIVEQTINSIESTEGFSFHKEVKIFFVGEEAQDAGGVLKEWIFSLLQTIFSKQSGLSEGKTSPMQIKKKKLLKSKSFNYSNEESKYKDSDNGKGSSQTPKSSKMEFKLTKKRDSSKSFKRINLDEEEEGHDRRRFSDDSFNFEALKADKEIFYHPKNTAPLYI
mmetsp:Transcript_11509/g.10180  ORF Transcript_11509/g.10180 Transcript_11509/m.10180 type:complete len:312 (+) Transcript_11509:161-1096(+)